MNWENIISAKRAGDGSTNEEQRTDFQRDYDRLIFSSAFRRLQNKTQVFPLPGSTFVHNRLTHSLEVASVGRSLGKIAGAVIAQNSDLNQSTQNFYNHDLANVIAAACLAHDIGNPAFGHSGEDAISDYFRQSEGKNIAGKTLRELFDADQWQELCDFEGNANAFRVLTHHYKGKSSGGYRLTYSTLAATQKYPCQRAAKNKNRRDTKKYGFFISESETMKELALEVNMKTIQEVPLSYFRHPFVYLTEAADDICYRIIDLEDAQRLGIIDYKTTEDLLLRLIKSFSNEEQHSKTCATLNTIGDNNEKTSYLRAKVINELINACAQVFSAHHHDLLSCTMEQTLMDIVEAEHPVLKEIEEISIEKIYSHDTVVHIELAGYHVMSKLLDLFVPAVLTPSDERSSKQKKTLRMLPEQYKPDNTSSYNDVRLVLDYISGMTDLYATEFYQNAFGFEVPKHR